MPPVSFVPRIGALALIVVSSFLVSCGDGGTEPTDDVPAALQIVAGDEQEGIAGEELDDALVVRVVNEDGAPVEGQLVNFRVVSGGGSVFAGSGLSNANGLVQDRWTLGTSTAAEQRVEARAVDPETGDPIVFATFTAIALPGPVATVNRSSGDAQPGALGTTLPQPLGIVARDEYTNPVPDAAVTWQVTSGGGTVTPASTTTNADGQASTSWTLGTTHGVAQTVTATVGGHTVTFTAAPTLPQDLVVTPSGSGQIGTVGTPLSQPLTVRLTTPSGAPVAGVPVMWSTTSGGSLTPPSTVTNEDGIATATWTLPSQAGTHVGTARIDDQRTAEFTATARPGAAASARIVSGTLQTGAAGELLAQPFVLVVEDEFGNPVPDVPVAWVVVAGGGTLSDADAETGPDGQAAARFTLGQDAGQNEVRATASGFPALVFVAAATAAAPARMEKVAGDLQVGKVGLPLETPLTVRLLDQFGNAVPSHHVSARVLNGGGWFTTPEQQHAYFASDAQGFVRIPFTTGGAPEPQVIEVTLDDQIERFTITPRAVPIAKLSENRAGCAIQDGGRLLCWTRVGSTSESSAVEPMPGRTFKDVSLGGVHSCAVETSGLVWCRGNNRAGSLGDGTTTNRAEMVPVASDVRFERVVTGALNTCAITAAGDVYCWGVGRAEGFDSSCWGVYYLNDVVRCVLVPVEVVAARGIGSLSLNDFNPSQSIVSYYNMQRAYGLDAAGTLQLWGLVSVASLYTDPTMLRFSQLDAGGGDRLCGLTTSGEAYCRGSNIGPLGNGQTTGSATFVPIPGHTFTRISTGADHTCALSAGGQAFCWGNNSAGQLGDGTTTARLSPAAVKGDLRFTDIEAGTRRTCGRLLDGGLVCWGVWGASQPNPWLMAWPVPE